MAETSADKYQAGGSLPANSHNYVERQADKELFDSLKNGEFCYVLTSRQMGKSSLLVRTMNKLQAEGIACAAIYISSIGCRDTTPEQWYAGMIFKLVNSFELSHKIDIRAWWQARNYLSPVQRFGEFVEQLLVAEVQQNIVLFIDEIDSVLGLKFPIEDFFAWLRSCYNKRAENPEYRRLTFAVFGVATPYDFIQDRERTPFNIGKYIKLSGFNIQEVKPLAVGIADRCQNPKLVLERILLWTGGQPFLTQKVCQLVQTLPQKISLGKEAETIDRLVQAHIISNWEAQDEPPHLKIIRDRLLRNRDRTVRLLGLYQQILAAGEVPADNSPEEIELLLSGLAIDWQGKLKVFNWIYATIFHRAWVEEQLAQIRPYAAALAAWLASNHRDESQLLRGEALQNALRWAANKSLSEGDYQFLSASQELDLQTVKQQFAGSIQGRYQIVRLLGRGGFSETYLATDKYLPGQPYCVVKKLKIQSSNHIFVETAIRLFDREAEVLYKMGKHEQIPQLFAHFQEERELYLVQEFIDGDDLARELATRGQLREREAIALLVDVLQVLEFVHQQGVVHRNIKPSSLIRRKSDNKIVLVGFGTAKEVSFREQEVCTIIGTPGYMAPEQMEGRPNFSSDIYALGAIAIQALTGIFPAQLPIDPNTGAFMWRNRAPVSDRLAAILDKMVSVDPRDRYQSAAEILQAIERFINPPTLLPTAISYPHPHQPSAANIGNDITAIPPPSPIPVPYPATQVPSYRIPASQQVVKARNRLWHKAILVGGLIGTLCAIGFFFTYYSQRSGSPNLSPKPNEIRSP